MSKLRESARGQDCLVRLPGVFNRNPETVVLAHLGGGGMAYKTADYEGSFCCSSCHDALDGRVTTDNTHDELELMHRQGATRTRDYWVKEGLIKIA
jgi:hypothetical protein